MSPGDSPRDLAAGYALGALSPEETRAFEAALAADPALAREVAEYREVGALLALGGEREPPAGLKARLRERIHATDSPATPRRFSGARVSRRPLTPVGLGLGLAATLLLAAGLAIRVGSLNQTVRGQRDSLAAVSEKLRHREATLNALLEPDVQLTTLTATGAAPIVQIFWNKARHTMVLHAFRLPPAPSGRIYQLWLMRGKGAPLASRLFDTEADGHGLVESVEVPADEPISGFAITLEPAGGSPQPTTAPIVFGNVPAS